jgi:hypothetical protein
VNSNEFSATKYKVLIKTGDRVLQEWPEIELAPGENWETTYDLQDRPLDANRLEVQLYRLDRPQSVYRQVWLAPGAVNESTNAP